MLRYNLLLIIAISVLLVVSSIAMFASTRDNSGEMMSSSDNPAQIQKATNVVPSAPASVPEVTKKAAKVTLGDSFKKAHDSFANKNTKTAVAEIRKEAKFIKSISEQTANASREPLMTSAKDLETLADGIEKGTVTSVKELDDAFANASMALAKHYSLKISESLANKDEKKAGKDFKAVADYLNAGFEWAKIEPDKGATAVMKSASEIAKETAKGTKLEESKTSKIISDLNAEIEKVSAKLATPATQTKAKETTKTSKTEPAKKPVGVK